MNIDAAKIGKVLSLVPLITVAIDAVEKLVTAKKGKEKQDAAVDMVGTFLALAEASIDRDLLNDADVDRAVRAVIDAIVAFKNLVERKQIERAILAAGPQTR